MHDNSVSWFIDFDSTSFVFRLYYSMTLAFFLIFPRSPTLDKFSRRRILNNAWREFTVFPGTRYFAYIENVKSDDTRSTAINTVLDNDPDTLTQRWKHFSEHDPLIKSRPVSLPCFSRRFLKKRIYWNETNRSFCACYRVSFSISTRKQMIISVLTFCDCRL